MDILKVKTHKKLLNTQVEVVGKVIGSFATNMGWWLKIADDKGYNMFVFSPKFNFNMNDLIVVKGVVKRNELYGVYIQGTRVIRRQAAPVKVVQKYVYVPVKEQKMGILSKIDPRILIIIAVALSLIGGFFLYPLLE